MFSVVVGVETPKTFLLHTALLIGESDRLAKDIESGFEETTKKRIVLSQEDPGLFGYFVEYLYKDTWLREEQISRDTDYVVLARLYALGEGLPGKDMTTRHST